MNKMVLIVNGSPGSGKTTFANIVGNQSSALIYSSIDYVKEVYKRYFDWDEEKTDASRKFLSNMKEFLINESDLLEEDLKQKYAEFGYSDARILIIDIREISEIKKYKKLFNAKTVFIRNSKVPILDTNKSDAQVENYDYDYTIDNDGTMQSFRAKVTEFLADAITDSRAKIYFRSGNKVDHFLQEISSIEDGLSVIYRFLEEKGFISHYQRQYRDALGDLIVDFGNHTEFFVIKNLGA